MLIQLKLSVLFVLESRLQKIFTLTLLTVLTQLLPLMPFLELFILPTKDKTSFERLNLPTRLKIV